MVGDKIVKLVFIEPVLQNTSSAGFNRFMAIRDMVSINFDYEILKFNNIAKDENKYIRAFRYRYKFIFIILKFLRRKDAKKHIVFYLFGISPFLALLTKVLLMFSNIKIICEINEFPKSIIMENKIKFTLHKYIIYSWYYKLFDGFSIITVDLFTFISKFNNLGVKVILPMTVDFKRFSTHSKEKTSKYILYVGSLNQKKDGILYLIKAFKRCATEIQDLELYIAYNSSEEIQSINEFIISNNLYDRVKLFKNVDRQLMPKMMEEASICVLPRPDSPQARGGFPTKLGEYLASGTPVISTNVGELPTYLSKHEVFFISMLNIENEIYSKVIQIFNDYKYALMVGQKGKNKAFSVFGLETNSEILKKMINRVVQ